MAAMRESESVGERRRMRRESVEDPVEELESRETELQNSSDAVSGAPDGADHSLPIDRLGSPGGGAKCGAGFLRYGIVATLTGASAAAGYATYAYISDEIEEKTKALRESVNYTVADDASVVETCVIVSSGCWLSA